MSAYTEDQFITLIDTLIKNNATPDFLLESLFEEIKNKKYHKVIEKMVDLLSVAFIQSALRVEINKYIPKDYKLINILLTKSDLNPSFESNILFRFFCNEGNLDFIKILMNDKRLIINEGSFPIDIYGLKLAISGDNMDVLKLLLSDNRFSAQKNIGLIEACVYGRIDMVKLFLGYPDIDPLYTYNDMKAINTAFKNKYFDIVKLLIPKVDLSKITDPRIIAIANEMKPLKKVSNVYDALDSLMNEYHLKSITVEKGKEFKLVFDS